MAVEEDLTDDDSAKDLSFMPGRQDIDSDDSNPPENIMPTKDTDQPNFDVNELFKTPNLQSKEAKEVEESRKSHSIQALADHSHSKRLDNLWRANGLTRQSVYGDGDCFFPAALLHVDVVYAFFYACSCVNTEDKLHVDQ